MSEHETVADIIAEMRALSTPISDSIIAINGRSIADRLEAAFKREKATAEKSSTVGDCAKLRKALKAARRTLKLVYENAAEFVQPRLADEIIHTGSAIEDALAAPPRNCDAARDWLHLYANFKPPATVRREMPPEWVDAVMAFCRWLVAQAKDAKGENNANK